MCFKGWMVKKQYIHIAEPCLAAEGSTLLDVHSTPQGSWELCWVESQLKAVRVLWAL